MMRMTFFFLLSMNSSPSMPSYFPDSFLDNPKKTPFSVISLICLRAKPEWLHHATGKFLTTVLSREILLHFERYELDTKEGTTTVHYGPALPVFYKSGYWSLMIACDFPATMGGGSEF